MKTTFSGGGLILTTMNGEELPHPANSDAVKNTMYKKLTKLKPQTGDLDKKERPGGPKTLKGDSGKI